MEDLQQKTKKRRPTPLGFIIFTIVITFCAYIIINFFVGGIPWQIVLAAVVLAMTVWLLK